jgi:short-subunit dehydrogenase
MSTVLITGASSGIGKQLALDYAAQGQSVIACGRSQEKLSLLEGHERITTRCFDVTDLHAVKTVFHQLPSRPKLWIFNAGDCEYIDQGVIDSQICLKVMQINFFGIVHCLEAAQSLLEPGDHVAVTGSVASEIPLPRAEAYGASKAAMSYLISSLQLDWYPKGITTSLILPGFVDTPLTERNTFAMPMCISAEQASARIRAGLARRKARIYFPFVFTAVIRLIRVLPYAVQQFVIRHFTKG